MLIPAFPSPPEMPPVVHGGLVVLGTANAPSAESLAASFFARYRGSTLRTYQSRLRGFALWMGVPLERLPAEMLGRGGPQMHLDLERFRAHLRDDQQRTTATINGYLAAIRSVVRFLRRANLCVWLLDVDSERVRPYRDTRGPGQEAIRAMLAAAAAHSNPRMAARDVALLRCLHDRALRRNELVSLNVEHVECSDRGVPVAIHVMAKGETDRIRLSLPGRTRSALAAWLVRRNEIDVAPTSGPDTRPLFVALDRGAGRSDSHGQLREIAGRLTGDGLASVLRSLQVSAGVTTRVRPHGIRHTAITTVLDQGESLRDAQRFSRHRDVRTLQLYDDNRADLDGAVSERLSELV